MGIRENIIENITKEFQPDFLEVIDESEKHRGHANWIEGKSTHFRVLISASQLAPLSRVQQHRAVMKAIEGEFEADLHALAIEVLDKRSC